jgi:hypothetical protein
MTAFSYGGFYDVPRCIRLRYQGRRYLLLSAFDEALDEYPAEYSVYELPELTDDSQPVRTPEFLSNTPMDCVGQIPIDSVVFDPTKRKELDASVLDPLIADFTREP